MDDKKEIKESENIELKIIINKKDSKEVTEKKISDAIDMFFKGAKFND